MPLRQRLIGIRWVLLLGVLALAATQALAQDSPSEARMRKDIFFLASEQCEGRGVETKGIQLAAEYIINEFKKIGLKPGAGKDSYEQPFTINWGISELEGPDTLVLKGPQGQTIELEAGKDFAVLGTSPAGKLTNAPLVFAGYGVTAPGIKYDDYKDLDVKDKVVLVIRRVPRYTNSEAPFDGNRDKHSGLVRKFATAATVQKAAAVLLVNDPSEKGDKLIDFKDFAYERAAAVPTLQVSRPVADRLLASGLGTGLTEVEKDIDRDLKPRSGVVKGWTVSLETQVTRTKNIPAKNIIGVLEGKGPLANETVVVGAHYDHVGYGNFGSRGKKEEQGKKIHFGADDNASGTTAVMELARRFAAMKDRQGRRLVFMLFSGEEKGLLGSQHYSEHPLFPLKDTVFMLNLDMVGRMVTDKSIQKDILVCEGVKTGEGFEELVDKINGKYNFQITKKSGTSPYSDHASFYRKKVPIIFYWTDTHVDYHRPGDTPDKINIPGMKKIVDMSQDLLTHMTTTPERPKFLQPKGDKVTLPRTKGPTLGIAPSYSDDNDGLAIASVTEGRPAQKAGLKAEDKIIMLAGREIRNINGYMAVMATLKSGEAVEVVVRRKGKEVKLKVTPEVSGN